MAITAATASTNHGLWTMDYRLPTMDSTHNIHPVTISSRACEEIRHIIKTKGIPADYGLRVDIKGGGCGGMSLIIGFDRKKETDLSYVTGGITVYVNKKHAMYLIGKQVDFIDESDARGFSLADEPIVKK